MTVSSQSRKAGPFLGNGITTVYPFDFKVSSKTDLRAITADKNGVQTPLVLDSDYSVTLNADQEEDPGGSITYPITGAPLADDGARLVILGDTPYTQPTEVNNLGGFYPKITEGMADHLEKQIQQVKEQADRALTFQATEEVQGQLPPAAARAGNVMGYDPNGNLIFMPIPASVGAGDMKTDVFEASAGDFVPGTTTQLTLSRAYRSIENILVFFGASYQGPNQIESLNDFVLTFKDPIPLGVDEVFVRGGTSLSAFTPSSGTVGDDQVAEGAGIQSSKLMYQRSDALAAVPRTGRVKWDDIVSAKDFNIKANGSFDDTNGFLDLMDYFQTADDFRGGRVALPKGRYMSSVPLAFTASPGGVHNMIIHGDGPLPVILDFTPAPAGTDGISFNAGAHLRVQDLMIYNAKRDGLVLGAGTTPGGPGGSTTHVMLKNLRIQQSGRDGVRIGNGFMISLDEVFSLLSGAVGINIQGFITSTKVARSYAWLSTGIGWVVNGATYSSFLSCGADSNGQQGYAVSNVRGVSFFACGAEENGADAWGFFTSDASVGALPIQDVRGVTMEGCFAFSNSKSAAGAFGSLLGAYPSNARPIEVSVRGGGAMPGSASDRAMVLNGAGGGQVTIHKDLVDVSTFSLPDFLSGSVEVTNNTVTGRRTTSGLSAATQTLTSGVATTMSLSSSPVMNDLGCTVAASQISTARDVHRGRISGSVRIAANGTGIRQVTVRVNGVNSIGLPDIIVPANASGDTIINFSSVPIFVTESDKIDVQVFQNSGGALNIVQGNSTYLCLEALG